MHGGGEDHGCWNHDVPVDIEYTGMCINRQELTKLEDGTSQYHHAASRKLARVRNGGRLNILR